MQDLIDTLGGNQSISSIVVIFGLLALRFLSDGWIDRRTTLDGDDKRRTKTNVRNVIFFIAVIALIFIWAPSLRTFALSLTAFAVAIILATKELILCLSGYVLKTFSGAMRVGDWVDIGGTRGEVVDERILTTAIEELGKGAHRYAYTGRTVVIPNSMFLTAPVKNERFNKRYTFHPIHITIRPGIPCRALCDMLMAALTKEMEEFEDVAVRYKSLIEKRADMALPPGLRDCDIDFQPDGNIDITLRCFVPVPRAIDIERRLKSIAAEYIGEFSKAGNYPSHIG